MNKLFFQFLGPSCQALVKCLDPSDPVGMWSSSGTEEGEDERFSMNDNKNGNTPGVIVWLGGRLAAVG